MAENDDTDFKALVEVMERNPRPLALLGAGTSLDSGYPDWTGLLALMAEKAGKFGPKYQAFLDELKDPAWQAEEYLRQIGKDEFEKLIASVFGPAQQIGEMLHLIVALQFRHILTTNYDPCIEEAYKLNNLSLQVTDWNDETNMRRFFLDLSKTNTTPHLVYLHGRYVDPGKVVLTESSYADRYVRSDDANRKLFAILITQPVVFIGFSVTDPDLNHLMREVNARLGSGTPPHFALVGYRVDEQRELIQSRFQRKYGIRPVFYRVTVDDRNREDHSALLALLNRLYESVHGTTRARPETTLAKEAGILAREESMAETLVKSGPGLPLDPLDQQKGRWGGHSENGARRLRVETIQASKTKNHCAFELVVEPIGDGAPPLEGPVVFHLHQTFNPSTHTSRIRQGKARVDIKAYGAFTVGAEADAGRTRLELDLAQVEQFPEWFRAR